MKLEKARTKLAYCCGGMLLAASLTSFASPGKDGTQAQAVVTVMAKRGKESRPIARDAVNVSGNRSEVEAWTPLTGSHAGLQLLILLDDSSSSRIDIQLADIKRFIIVLPATTQVAIGYMQNGRAVMTQTFTTNHAAAAKTVRSTFGSPGINGSPYFVLEDVIKNWPAETGASAVVSRREILMVTDGVDRYSGERFDPENPYVLSAIREAQRAGVLVHSIYYRGAGGVDANAGITFGGQNYLEEVAQATGGKSYTEGLGNPVSFQPFLDELNQRLQNQYELSFITGERADHGLVPLKLKIQAPNVSVNAPAMARINRPTVDGGMK